MKGKINFWNGDIAAAEGAQKHGKPGKLSLKHVEDYIKELKKAKIPEERKSPMLLPDYRGKNTLARMIDIL